MKMICDKYIVETRFYDKSVQRELFLPKNSILLKNNISGVNVSFEEFCSLIGWIKIEDIDIDQFYELNNGLHIKHYEIKDYFLFYIEHIKFIKFDRPIFVEPKEFMQKTNLNDYYLIHKYKDKLDNEILEIIKNNKDISNKSLKKYIIRGNIYRIDKILNVNGVHDIEVYTVDENNISVYHTNIFSLFALLDNPFTDSNKEMIISTTSYNKFIEMQNKILNNINHKIGLL